MQTISIKEFQQNMYQHLGDLPLCVTRYGKPLFFVTNNAEEKISIKKGKPRPVSDVVEEETPSVTKPENSVTRLDDLIATLKKGDKEIKIENNKKQGPFSICEKHGGFRQSCGCD